MTPFVHVFWTRPEEVGPERMARLLAILDESEKARVARINRDEQRRADVVARALVRTVLSRYAPIVPSAWTFAFADRGKPYVHPSHAVPLRFNLTHTTGLVACIVSEDREVGIDAEWLGRRCRHLELARRFFSAPEVALVLSVPPDQQLATMLRIWTLKEAYLKARGLGLSLRLSDFFFSLEPLGIGFAPGFDDTVARWQMAQIRPTESHVLSVAIDRQEAADVPIAVSRMTP